jgi:hypothetical protein
MKRSIILFAGITVAVVSLIAEAARLGTLNSNSTVYTPADDIVAPSVTTKDGFPVFEIRVPDGLNLENWTSKLGRGLRGGKEDEGAKVTK